MSVYHGWVEPEERVQERMERNRLAYEMFLAQKYAAEQAEANFRAGAEYLARLEAEQQRMELAAEADWLDAKSTLESLLAWMR